MRRRRKKCKKLNKKYIFPCLYCVFPSLLFFHSFSFMGIGFLSFMGIDQGKEGLVGSKYLVVFKNNEVRLN